MSPSMISKILCGYRSIGLHDTEEFSSKAAIILAEAIYAPDCCIKFGGVFPVIHDFATRFDLEQFLFDAIRYSINKDNMIDELSGKCESNEHFSAQQQILNMFCIILSDYITENSPDTLEAYSTLLQYGGQNDEIFSRIRILPNAAKRHIIFHQLNDPDVSRVILKDPTSRSLDVLYRQEAHTDLYRWRSKLEIDTFLLLRDHFVLLFNKLLDGSLHMTLIRKEAEVERFCESVAEIMKKATCLSISEDHLHGIFSSMPWIEKYSVAEKIRTLINLEWSQPKPEVIANFFRTITEDGSSVHISTDVLPALLHANQVFLPAVKRIEWPLQARLDHLTFLHGLVRKDPKRINIVNAMLGSIMILCDDELSLLCVVNPTNKKMKYHVVDSRILKYELEKSTARSGINTVEYMQTLLRNAQHEMQQTNRLRSTRTKESTKSREMFDMA
ncbi:MAG TPA: hypothetical protein GXZ64_09230 [Clostridiaceae bacterium]|nr:hypothetical protein [Clostridiaceae bacterium]